GPVISGVTVTEITDSTALVTWTTEEPSDSVVTYGTAMPPVNVVTDEQMVLIHEVLLTNLEQCTGHVFMVGSTDAAGNETVDNNSGAYYGFTTWELVAYINETMDTDPGWTYENQWAWGIPLGNDGDPSSGYTGNNVIGYNLAGDYTNNMPNTYCTTTPFDCSTATQVIFSFYKWLGVESATWDHASIEVSGNGGSTWTVIWEHTGSSTSPSTWTYEEYDVSDQLAGQDNCLIRWNMGPTDSSVTYCGWNIDDVLVSYTQPCEEPCINNGDVNQNGEITAGDAQMAFQIALGQISPTPEEFCSADCNGDEEVTAGDAQQVFMTALGSATCVDPLI
ncbi:MAG TPA: dockerin type I domain-containing protein, partial [bacterium]|nr:dockerin type I domain-containing protein [bacterium]